MNLSKLVKKTCIFALLPFAISNCSVLASSNDCLSQVWQRCEYCEGNVLHEALNKLCVFNSIFYNFLNLEEQVEYSQKNDGLYRNFMLENNEQVIADLKGILKYINNKLIGNETPPCIVLLRHRQQIQESLEQYEKQSDKKKLNDKLINPGAIMIKRL